MENLPVSQDDLLDVMEMTQKIEKSIAHAVSGNELTLAMSAIMSASINSVLAPCKTLDEVVFYRNLFVQIFDSSIRQIKLK